MGQLQVEGAGLPPDTDRYRAAAGLPRIPVALAPPPPRDRRTITLPRLALAPRRTRPARTPKAARTRRPAGTMLVGSGAWLLGVLAAALFVVTLNAQYKYVFAVKHQSLPAYIEAASLDLGMAIFTLLALGLAVAKKKALLERFLIVACAAGSAGQNYAAADPTSVRSVAAYVVPSLFLALVVDRVIAVVRRHFLGEDERSVWLTVGRALAKMTAWAAVGLLYLLRLLLDPAGTFGGMRRAVLAATPVPAKPQQKKLQGPPSVPSTPPAGQAKVARPHTARPHKPRPAPAGKPRPGRALPDPARVLSAAALAQLTPEQIAEEERIADIVRNLPVLPSEYAIARTYCGGRRPVAKRVLARATRTGLAAVNGTTP